MNGLLAAIALGVGGVATAAAPPCAVAGRIPDGLQLQTLAIEEVAPLISMLNWSDGQKLQLADVRKLVGKCADAVVGFVGSDVFLRGGLVVRWNDAGEFSAAVVAGITPGAPVIPEVDADGHAHGGLELGDFTSGSRIAVGPADRSANEYFVGVWRPTQGKGSAKQSLQGATLAVYARTREGIFSGAAPLMRSTLTVRSVFYQPGADAQTGLLGIVQEAADSLYLINMRWTHRDYTH